MYIPTYIYIFSANIFLSLGLPNSSCCSPGKWNGNYLVSSVLRDRGKIMSILEWQQKWDMCVH